MRDGLIGSDYITALAMYMLLTHFADSKTHRVGGGGT